MLTGASDAEPLARVASLRRLRVLHRSLRHFWGIRYWCAGLTRLHHLKIQLRRYPAQPTQSAIFLTGQLPPLLTQAAAKLAIGYFADAAPLYSQRVRESECVRAHYST